ncbi:MAG: ABC transporter substrate-binding protein [Pseudomonadota bacterium]
MKKRNLLLLSVLWLGCMIAGPVSGQESITVGAVMPLTGVFAFAGGDGAMAMVDAFTMVNEAGGIHGKKIKWVIEDGQYKVDVASEAFRRIMARDNPLVMFGESTALGKAMAQDINSRYHVLYGSTSFSGELAQPGINPYTFVAGPTYGDMFAVLLKYIAKEKPGAKVAFFYSDSEFGTDPIKFGRITCERLRLNWVGDEVVPLGSTDISAQIAGLKRKDPDFVIFQGFLFEPVPSVIRKCRELGMKCTFMGTFWGATKLILDKLGPLAEGYTVVNPYMYWWNDEVPMINKIRALTEKYHPEVKYRDNFYMQVFMNALIAVECLKRADKAGRLNGPGLLKALQSLEDFDSGGLCAPVSIRNNRFPVARVWRANVEKKIYEPVSDWIKLDKHSDKF